MQRLLSLFAFLCILCGASIAAGSRSAAKTAEGNPNLIFILSDDLAQGDLGCYGQKHIATPNLDRMAREGTRYTQAYCGTSVCAPSRSSLMTGLHSGHCPVRGNWEIAKGEGQYPLPAETVTVAQILQGAGYATACAGKWGMGMFDTTGSPLKKGFDHFFGYNCQRYAHSYFPAYLYHDDKQFELPGNDGKGVGKTYAQNLIEDDVLAWVRSKKDGPFFLFYAITLPHGKFEIDDQGLYKDQPWSDQAKNYAAMVTRLDSDVGRLLTLLKEIGIDDKTLVMLAGDNGSSFGPNSEMGKLFNQAGNGLRGFKRGLYEGALRQAALARWPGVVPPGRVSDEPWAFWDFLPTAAELAGVAVPDNCKADGLSLVSFLKGGPAPQREHFYWELHEGKPVQAVRFGHWKAVKNGPQAKLELYDLAADPGEKTDLAAEQPAIVEIAAALLVSSRTASDDWPLTGPAERRKKQSAGAFKSNPPAGETRATQYLLDPKTPEGLQALFKYTGEPLSFVSAHRGGAMKGFPENCLATFENTLAHAFSIMEIDPRYTKDGGIVLYHDADLGRTSTGKGRVAELSLAELKELKLKDPEGNVTEFRMPTLDEALEWARGRTILVLDQKDVSAVECVKKIAEHKAESYAMVIVSSFKDAQACHALNPNVMMEIMIPNRAKFAEFDALGVPWRNVVAFVGHIPPEDPGLYGMIHAKGACCMIGTSRNLDLQFTKRKMADLKPLEPDYRAFLKRGADLIETDIPVPLGPMLYRTTPVPPSKKDFFHSK